MAQSGVAEESSGHTGTDCRSLSNGRRPLPGLLPYLLPATVTDQWRIALGRARSALIAAAYKNVTSGRLNCRKCSKLKKSQ